MDRTVTRVVVLMLCLLWPAALLSAGDVAPTPFDAHRLVCLRAGDFRDTSGKPVTPVKDAAALEQKAVAVGSPVHASALVREKGQHVLWLRVAQRRDAARGLTVELLNHDRKKLLTTTVGRGEGDAKLGGPAAYREFVKQATVNTPASAVSDSRHAARTDMLHKRDDKTSANTDDLAEEMLSEMRQATGENWTVLSRVEKPGEGREFYWWNAGTVELDSGAHVLTLAPPGPLKPDDPAAPLVDAAILTTQPKLAYPFLGDIAAPRASYVRFRIDHLPGAALNISGHFNTHAFPAFRSETGIFSPLGVRSRVAGTPIPPHSKTGYTRWYCLQDIERCPGLGSGVVELHLTVDPAPAPPPVPGASTRPAEQASYGVTQFAMRPHQDAIIRTIQWNEPEGLNISMQMDFEAHPELLRTHRDHAREQYEYALNAVTGPDGKPRLFPLTRPGLYFTNSWGQASGGAMDYMLQTVRLLGFNSVASNEPVRSRRAYGWNNMDGIYAPPGYMPFDEADSARKLDEHFQESLAKRQAEMEGVATFWLADEPGEYMTTQMTAPLWRWVEAQKKWIDLCGDSELRTARLDHRDCVLEGKLEKYGQSVALRAAIDDHAAPKRFIYWVLGKVNDDPTFTVAYGKADQGKESKTLLRSRAAVISEEGTPFKIVHQGERVALFVRGELIVQTDGLPRQGGFAIGGGPKGVSALAIRPIRKDEHIAPQGSDKPGGELMDVTPARGKAGGSGKGNTGGSHAGSNDDDLDLGLDDGDAAAKAKPLSLKEWVEKEWTWGGGVPGAHEGFRRWAAAQGVQPALFGKSKWEDVRMLTVAALARDEHDARLYYWSRRYAGFLTPRLFSLAAQGLRKNAPDKSIVGTVALSGHSLYFPSQMPLDMFRLASEGHPLMPGISDFMSFGGWRWDSSQAVAFSVAPYNAGARRFGRQPVSFPMMHCGWPITARSYTQLANQVKFISYWNFGPSYAVTEWYWSDGPSHYPVVSLTNNRAALVDDILRPGLMRPSRVAMLYAMSTEYWHPQASFADKRATFLGLAHEYFQPELVTEDQIVAGDLAHYDALYVLDPWVSRPAQEAIGQWARGGGLLWACADAMSRDEFNQPCDGVATLSGVKRTLTPPVLPGDKFAAPPQVELQARALDTDKAPADGDDHAATRPAPNESPAQPVPAKRGKSKPPTSAGPERIITAIDGDAGLKGFRAHSVALTGMPQRLDIGDGGPAGAARVRARYDDGSPAWIERSVGKGRMVYVGHRAGLTYSSKAIRRGGYEAIWADTGRATLTLPLHEAKVARELVLSEPIHVASPLSTDAGTVIVMHNMMPTPHSRKDVVIELKEPAKPVSVEAFEGYDLKPAPYEFADGRVRITLASFDGPQMVVVRRKPAPPDDRIEALRKRTLDNLASNDPIALSAGAFVAGFHPEWDAAKWLPPLLKHPRWEVRRSAAEALGRIGGKEQANALHASISKETDAHAAGEMCAAIMALTNDGSSTELDPEAMGSSAWFFRLQQMRAIARHAMRSDAKGRDRDDADGRVVATLSYSSDKRVIREIARARARLSPAQAKDHVLDAFGLTPEEEQLFPVTRAEAMELIAFPGMLDEVLKAPNLSDDLVLALAQRVPDARVLEIVHKRYDSLLPGHAGELVMIAASSRDPVLARRLWDQRDKLPKAAAADLPFMLEHVFAARLGSVAADWDEYMRR